jgi:mono/diheme cytochrome c family protein
MVRWLVRLVVLVALALVVAQVIPYERDHTNPPETRSVKWNEPTTRALMAGACLDCHSNLTSWPWYSKVAPVSWLVSRDVREARSILNFSEWDRPQAVDAAEILEVVREDEMPPLQYKLIHSKARLSDRERAQLLAGLAKTLAADPLAPGSGRGEGD